MASVAGLDRCKKRATADFALIGNLAIGDREGDCSGGGAPQTIGRLNTVQSSSATAGVATDDVASVTAREATLRAKCKRRIAMLLRFIAGSTLRSAWAVTCDVAPHIGVGGPIAVRACEPAKSVADLVTTR